MIKIMGKIYHYTTIETLALILKNKTIRFSRLDTLNDLEEGHITSCDIDVGKLAYVSCWTENPKEAIPLWRIYGKDSMGVRIALEKDMFKDYEWTVKHCRENNSLNIPVHGNGSAGKFKIPFSDCLNDGCVMIPPTTTKSFYFPMHYVEDIKPYIEESASITQKHIESINLSNIGQYKHERWAFEEESRFIIYKHPIDIFEYLKDSTMETHSSGYINNRFDDLTSYDMHLKDDIFNSLEVRLSPSANESHKIIVDSLLKEYAPKAICEESELKTKIKFK